MDSMAEEVAEEEEEEAVAKSGLDSAKDVVDEKPEKMILTIRCHTNQ